MAKIEWIGALKEKEEKVVETQIQKIAQRRSILQWLHEKANLPRHAAEMFSDNYQNQMHLLREVDDALRQSARGLENFVDLAKRALKEHKFLDVIHFVGNINDTVKTMMGERKLLKELFGAELDDFYSQHEHADLERQYFEKNAGISDFFQGRARQRAGKLFEKMYHNVVKERRRAMNKLVDKAEALVEITMDTLKDLGTYRARGDIGDYVNAMDDLSKRREKFEKEFKETYDKHIVPLIQSVKSQKDEAQQTWVDKGRGVPDISTEPVSAVPELDLPEAAVSEPAVSVVPAVSVPDLDVPKKEPVPAAAVPVAAPDAPKAIKPAKQAPEAPKAPQPAAPAPAPAPAPKAQPAPATKQRPKKTQKITSPVELLPPQTPAAKLPAAKAERYQPVQDPTTGEMVPAWMLEPSKYKPTRTVELERDDKGNIINRKVTVSNQVIDDILKSGQSEEQMKEVLLAFAADFDDEDLVEDSLNCIAAVEALIKGG